MEIIKNYISCILGSIIMGALCELIMPRSNLKKYIEFVIGITLLLSILKPISTAEFGKLDFSESVQTFMCDSFKESQKDLKTKENHEELKNKKINEIYEKKLANEINNALTKKIMDLNFKVVVKTCNLKEKIGEVFKVEIFIKNKNEIVGLEENIYEILNNDFYIKKELVHIKQL